MSNSNYKQLDESSSRDVALNERSSLSSELSAAIESFVKMNNKLERSLAKIGTPADNSDFRDRMHEDQNESNAKVKQIMALLKRSSGGGLERNVFTRLSVQFDREFKKNQKLQTQMDSKQSDVITKAKERDEQQQPNKGGRNNRAANGAALDRDSARNGSNAASSTAQLQQSAMEDNIQFLEYDHEEIQRRTREIRMIESEVQEVAEMYKDMHLLVNEQQEGIDMIENNIQSTRTRVETATEQLSSAEDYQRGTRKRQCCLLFCILITIGVIVAVVYVSNAFR